MGESGGEWGRAGDIARMRVPDIVCGLTVI